MLHATIRTNRDAVHFIGAASPYSLQTLQEYIRSARRDEREVYLHVELGAEDEHEFTRHAQRWLRYLKRRGVGVDIQIDRSEQLWPARDADLSPPRTVAAM